MASQTQTFALALILASSAPAVQSQEDIHPWQINQPRFIKRTYFSNLETDATVETPFLLKFGLTGMGLATVAKPVPKTGHHHLLVNQGLPMDFSKPLPFNDRHIHFGKGQMETVLTFQPGVYTLQLLFADDKHVPNFVASEKIRVVVTKNNAHVAPASIVEPGVEILMPKSGDTVKKPFLLSMHASGVNVSHKAIADKGSGHFRIRIKPETGREEIITLANGYTEVWLNPPLGSYAAQVELLDNSAPNQVLFKSRAVLFNVRN